MKKSFALISLAFGIVLTAASISPVWAQPAMSWNNASAPGPVLTDEERAGFDARLRAAGNEQTRAKVTKERDDLVRTRLAQRGPSQAIPPGPHEVGGDLVMSDVPTPAFDQKSQMTNQPGGAFAPMETYGSNPFGRPVSDPYP